jgi:hypothetical protein
MTAQDQDRPDLVIFPPLILVVVLVLASALQWLAPLGVLDEYGQTWRLIIGGGLLLIGLVLTQAGARTLLGRAPTSIRASLPWRWPPTASTGGRAIPCMSAACR